MKLISEKLGQTLNRELLKLKASSPKLLFGIGIAGVITSTVLACRATIKLGPVLDDFKEELDLVKKEQAEINALSHSATTTLVVDRSQQAKDLTYVYVKGTAKIARLYAPAVLVGVGSIAALTASHTTLTRRNASLAAGFSALQAAYDAYRQRVREELGEEKELDIYQNARIEKRTVDGKVQNVKVVDPTKHSPYARFFDESSTEWQKQAEYNKLFLTSQQNYFNHLLHARGHVFLNEVYDNLGLERSSEGQVVGWLRDGDGDCYIDFGIFDVNSSRFVNNLERSILLDFNVDGPILNKI